jgi:hypothetical protein
MPHGKNVAKENMRRAGKKWVSLNQHH